MPLIGLSVPTLEGFERYITWLHTIDPEARFTALGASGNAAAQLRACDALLLPGGDDPHPALFGKEDPEGLCRVDPPRDELELTLIRAAVDLGLPMLGICRGLQIVNVALGGTLHLDLRRAGYEGHHKMDGMDQHHRVEIEPDTLMHRVLGESAGVVNSAHHQGVDLPAPRLRVCARTEDGMTEAMEWKDAGRMPFLLLMHWHPERLADAGGAFSEHIGRAFLDAARA